MKIALISDIHYGIRNDNGHVLQYLNKFFEELFFPYIESHNIKTVICLGDLVDRRKYINFYTAAALRRVVMEELMRRGIEFHWILGNHDIHLRDTHEINVAQELYQRYNFKYYATATEVLLDNKPFLFVPWIVAENREHTTKLIETTNAKTVFGHLELQGFEMYSGVVKHDGEDPAIYAKFDQVFTGHYHHRSSHSNIHYVGAIGQYNWSDYRDVRGFHTFDTSTGVVDFVENPFTLFEKSFYDDSTEACILEAQETDFTKLRGKFVKVIVKNRNNSTLYDWFLSRIEESETIEYQIVQDHLNMQNVEDQNIVDEVGDTLSIIRQYAATVNSTVDVAKLDALLVDLYQSAHSQE